MVKYVAVSWWLQKKHNKNKNKTKQNEKKYTIIQENNRIQKKVMTKKMTFKKNCTKNSKNKRMENASKHRKHIYVPWHPFGLWWNSCNTT